MDEIDRQLLDILQQDATLSIAQMAERVQHSKLVPVGTKNDGIKRSFAPEQSLQCGRLLGRQLQIRSALGKKQRGRAAEIARSARVRFERPLPWVGEVIHEDRGHRGPRVRIRSALEERRHELRSLCRRQ